MFLRVVTTLNTAACQLLLTVIVASVFVDVVMRYVLNGGFLAAGEFVPYLFTWFAFLSAALCFWKHEHFVVEFIVDNSGAFRPLILWVIRLIELAAFVCLIYFGWRTTMAQMAQFTPFLQIPYGLVYLSIPVSGVFMLIYGLYNIAALVAPGRDGGDGAQ